MDLRVRHDHFWNPLPFIETGVSDLVFGKMDSFLSEINRLDHKLQELQILRRRLCFLHYLSDLSDLLLLDIQPIMHRSYRVIDQIGFLSKSYPCDIVDKQGDLNIIVSQKLFSCYVFFDILCEGWPDQVSHVSLDLLFGNFENVLSLRLRLHGGFLREKKPLAIIWSYWIDHTWLLIIFNLLDVVV